MQSAPVGVEETSTYRPSLNSPRLRGVVAFTFVLGLVVTVIVRSFLGTYSSSGFSTGIGVYFLYYFTTTLTVDSQGFTYKTFGVVVRGRWSDVRTIARGRSTLLSWLYGEQLWLKQRAWWRMSSVSLEWFDAHWRTGQLGDDIRRYAPWLLADVPHT